MDQTQVTFTASWSRINSLSHGVIDHFGEEMTGNTIMTLALTLGRLMSTRAMSQSEEATFVTDLLDYAGAYFGAQKES